MTAKPSRRLLFVSTMAIFLLLCFWWVFSPFFPLIARLFRRSEQSSDQEHAVLLLEHSNAVTSLDFSSNGTLDFFGNSNTWLFLGFPVIDS